MTEYRYVGVTDESTECDLCGKMGLKSTVVLYVLDADGNDTEIVYYGSTCAAKVLGRTGRGQGAKVLDEARGAHRRLVAAVADARDMLAFYGVDGAQPFTAATVGTAMGRYAHQHRHAMWAGEVTPQGWCDRVYGMVARHGAVIRDAERLGL